MVMAARLFASALFKEGKNVQAIPSFGVERRGAPVRSFLKFSEMEESIPDRAYVHEPDYIVCMDSTLFDSNDVLEGLKDGGMVILNTPKDPGEVDLDVKRLATVDASAIARKVLRANILNTPFFGAFPVATKEFSLDSAVEVVKESFSGGDLQEKNVKAVREGFEGTRVREE